MKPLVRFTIGIVLWGGLATPVHAGFSSLYAFGDGVCTTTDGSGGQYYYGKRYTNGRVWIEVLAQRQGIAYEAAKNWSFFGHFSGLMASNVVNRFSPPPDAATALFVIWVSDADFVDNIENRGTNSTAWANAMNQTLTNHYRAITNLYTAKGARAFVLPSAVDISKAPFYSGLPASHKNFVRQRITDFNANFAELLNRLHSELSGAQLWYPDYFTLLDAILANPSAYGVTKTSIDAVSDPALGNKALNGPGANYLWWDWLDPTAKVHMHMADLAQQLISPVNISNLVPLGSSNRLDLVGVPIGRNGEVQASADVTSWSGVQAITSTNAALTVFVPPAGPKGFYRLAFPFAWSWP